MKILTCRAHWFCFLFGFQPLLLSINRELFFKTNEGFIREGLIIAEAARLTVTSPKNRFSADNCEVDSLSGLSGSSVRGTLC